MSRLPKIALVLVFLLLVAPIKAVAAAAPSAIDIMTRNFVAMKAEDSSTGATFRLIDAQGDVRIRQSTGVTKLSPGTTDNRRLVTFTWPADIHGTQTLLIEHSNADDDMWIYLPAMKKVRRLVASNKRDSFVGTDFSYGDVIGHKVGDWNHKFVREEKIGGMQCWVIESTPRSPEVEDISGYSKRISWIDERSYIALKTEIYDAQGALMKRITYEDVREVDPVHEKWQPMRMVAENVQTHHTTIIELTNFKANVGVSDEVFTPASLGN